MALEQLVDAAGWTLLHSLWQFTAIALLFGITLRFIASSHCQVRYVLACAALLLMIAAMAGTFAWQNSALSAAKADHELAGDSAEQLDVQVVPAQSVDRVATRSSDHRDLTATALVEDEPTAFAPSLRSRIEALLTPWIGHLVALWMLGVGVLSLRLCGNWLAVRRLRIGGTAIVEPMWTRMLARVKNRLALSQSVELLQSSAAAVPMVIGWLRPVILVPIGMVTAMTPGEIEAILAHELAHIRRHDYLVNLLQNVAETLLFYHPAVWWVSRQIRNEREFCCDAIAARLCDGTAAYARALTTVETMRSPPPMLSVAATGGSLLERIRRLADREPKPSNGGAAVVLVLSCVVLLAGIVGANTDGVQGVKEADTGSIADESFRVSGRVVDASGEPISDALVTCPLAISGKRSSASTHTAADGSFSFEIPADGDRIDMYHTWAYAKGHGIRTVMLRKLLHRHPELLKSVEIRLPPADPIQYRVLLPNGKACVGAVVRPRLVQVPNGEFSADEPTGLAGLFPDELSELVEQVTDDEGYVTFDAVPEALADSVLITVPGLGEQQFRQVGGELVLSPAGAIEGEVLAADPSEFAGTQIHVTTNGTLKQRDGQAIAELNEEGKFRIPAIAAGNAHFRMFWDDKHNVLPHLEDSDNRVVSGETLQVEIATRSAVSLTGRLLTEDTRRPIRNARLFVRNLSSPDFSQHPETDENGRFEAKVFAGPLYFQVVSLGKDEDISQNYGYPVISKPEVPDGVKDHSLGDILLPPLKLLAGTLLDSNGTPRAGAEIGIHTGTRRHLAGTSVTKIDGTFEIRVKDWKIQSDSGLKWVILSETSSPTENSELTRLRVVSEEPLVLQERPAKNGAPATPPEGFRHMTVRTVDDAGKPVANTRIYVCIWPDEDEKYKTSKENYFTDADGNARVLVPDPPRLFRVWTQQDGYVPLFAQWWPEQQPDGDQIPDEFTFTLPTGTKIGGTIVDDGGNPIEGATVEVMLVQQGDPGMRQRPVPSTWLAELPGPGENPCITDAQGSWSLDNVPAGDDVTVRVKLTHPDFINDTIWGGLQAEQGVTMTSLRDATAKIAMHSGIRARGTVTGDGKPVADAVIVWGDNPYDQEGSQEVRTNADGTYELPPLAPGVYPLTVVAEGWRPELSIVEIEDKMPQANFELKKGNLLRIKFVDEDGEPIPEVYVGLRGWRGKESLYNHKHPNVLDTKIPLQADKDGIYEWTWAPPDEVKYSFSKKGYERTESSLIADGEEHVVELVAE